MARLWCTAQSVKIGQSLSPIPDNSTHAGPRFHFSCVNLREQAAEDISMTLFNLMFFHADHF